MEREAQQEALMADLLPKVKAAYEKAGLPFSEQDYQVDAALHLAGDGNNNAEIRCGDGKTKVGIMATLLELAKIGEAGAGDGIIRTTTHESLSEKDASEGAVIYSQFGYTTARLEKVGDGLVAHIYDRNDAGVWGWRTAKDVSEAFKMNVIYCTVDTMVHRAEKESTFSEARALLLRSWRILADEGDVAFYYDINNTYLLS